MQKTYNSRGGNNRSHFAPRGGRNNSSRSSTIHASRYINKAIAVEDEEVYVPKNTFADFALNSRTKATIEHMGFVSPSPIQDQTIPAGLQGRDIIGLANTGTGKTAAFLLPIIEKTIDDHASVVTTLILAPTRELAQQIDEEFRRFSAGQKLFSTLVVGGANIGRQISQIKRGPHLIIGTPGRVKDLIDRKVLRLQNVTTFVLDEADRMCDMGFVKDIRSIESEMPKDRQTFCFSATMTADVKTIVEQFMRDPLTVSVVKNQTNDHIEQDVIYARDKMHKIELLTELLQRPEFEKVIVFGETKFGVQRLADNLEKSNLSAVAIHGNKSQSQRERALKSFKTDHVKVLVATDVAARGIDVQNVSHVINFDPPKQYDDYVHRIGRTGRAGKSGKALTFVIGQER
ncbi:MAG: putative box helicase domain protein [Candidatus Saccharibacteria bacterium]|nr:putative box helicase domain protein [Candidatus Saccharibacteria bacterium]